MTADDYAALGKLLLGELRASDQLGPIPSLVMERLAPVIRTIPPQFNRLGEEQSLGDWINAAAAIEAQGLSDLAFNLLEELRRVYVQDANHPRHRAMDAFIWLRRARIARVAGQLDDAEACYLEAHRRIPRTTLGADDLWWSDLLPNLWVGLGILAVSRGNYPLAERETRKAIDDRVDPVWRITALLQMTLVLRKRGRADDALLYIWQALDLLRAGDGRRTDTLIVLGEVLLELGEHRFALEALLAALAIATWQRHHAAALCGVQVLLAKADRHHVGLIDLFDRSTWACKQLAARPESTAVDRLAGYMADLLRRVPQSLVDSVEHSMETVDGWTRHEQSILTRSFAELLTSRGRQAEALFWLDISERIAARHNFHERKFEIETLRARWTASAAADAELTPPSIVRRKPRRSPEWARMAELEALATLEPVQGS